MGKSVVLLTDFGSRDPYAGVMKGVILSRSPQTSIIDLCHEIAPQDVRTAAFHLMTSAPYFPAGSIFVIVIDPGVGSKRRILWGRSAKREYLFPDNGVLGFLNSREPFREVREVTNRKLWLPSVSSTFHGRDIFAAVAGSLSRGVKPAQLGPATRTWKRLDFPQPKRGRGEILSIDRFGNAITTLQAEHLKPGARLSFKGRPLGPVRRSYAETSKGKPLALIGSSGFLEFSVRNGDFASRFKARLGDAVAVLSALPLLIS